MKTRFPLLISTMLASLGAALWLSADETSPRRSGVSLANFDQSTRPQDDFFEYVNGTWLKNTAIPEDKSRYAAFTELSDQTEIDLKAIIDTAAANPNKAVGSDAQKVGDLYASFMDQERINALGWEPIAADLKAIDALSTKEDVAKHLGHLQKLNISAPIGVYVDQDSKNSDQYAVHVSQAGLGLPDRDYYIQESDKFTEIRKEYVALIRDLLQMTGTEDAPEAAEAVLALETKLAQIHWSRVKNRDRNLTYNKISLADLKRDTPGWPWDAFLESSGLPKVNEVIVRQPDYLKALPALLEETSIDSWKHYMRFHVITGAASYLSDAFVDRDFAFFGKTLRGVEVNQPRWKRGVQMVGGSLGEILGKLYVEKRFTPEAKARMVELVGNLKKAFKVSIDSLDWMGPETKKAAQEKLAKFTTKIGYPDTWRDYSALVIAADDLCGNLRRTVEFEHQRNVNKLGKPVDRNEWFMTPQTVNAYYNPEMNEIVFPAAILQPPFFDFDADDAINYGAIGGVIGHEISHGFDDQGRKYDGDGNLRDWWTKEDAERYQERAKGLVDQYNAFSPIERMKVNGELTLGENIGDLSGITVAYVAYQLSLQGKEAPVIDGFTGSQRFFIGWAQCFRGKYRDEELRNRLLTDPHSPVMYRVNGVMVNVPAFYEAFKVKDGDKLHLPEADRIKLW